MKIGYARVSTDDQNLDLQRDALKAAGCDKIFEIQRAAPKPIVPGCWRRSNTPGKATPWLLGDWTAWVARFQTWLRWLPSWKAQVFNWKVFRKRSIRAAPPENWSSTCLRPLPKSSAT